VLDLHQAERAAVAGARIVAALADHHAMHQLGRQPFAAA
jgi:hypothetical protein